MSSGDISRVNGGDGRSVEEDLATLISITIKKETPLSRLLQYVIDVAGDQYISEEFYERDTSILTWLDACGCSDEEVRFRAYVISHPDIFSCKEPGCGGRIEGGCPKMSCTECGRMYYLNAEDVTNLICSRCMGKVINGCRPKSGDSCSDRDKRSRRVISAVDMRKRR